MVLNEWNIYCCKCSINHSIYIIKTTIVMWKFSLWTNDNVSLLSIDEQQSVSTSPTFEVYGHKILKADIEILESQSGWLNDSLINAGLNMLRSQFPGSSGLYDVSLANTLCYPDETHEDFIQILNVRHSHWVCVSNKSCNAGTIKILIV